MRSIQQTFQVRYSYPVHFTRDLFRPANTLLRDTIAAGGEPPPRDILCIVDRGVQQCHPDLVDAIQRYCGEHRDTLRLAAPPVLADGGEAIKNDRRQVTALHRVIHDAKLCRHSYVVAIGGGALLDMAGYAAATAHRGVRLIRVPTTVLAQADSGVGVKNSINAFDKKNFLGTFAPPFAVLNDLDFLTTLSDRDWRSGVAEAVKVALLKDASFFTYIETHAVGLAARDPRAMAHVIHRCAELHLQHIAGGGDPFESGSSRPLDFGHWSAHKLEQLCHYELRHGEAVAIGIALDSTYSRLSGHLSVAGWRRILDTLRTLGFALYTPELGAHLEDPKHTRCVFHGLSEFREHLGGVLTLVLLHDIGHSFETHHVDLERYARSIALLQEYHTSTGGSPWLSPKACAL